MKSVLWKPPIFSTVLIERFGESLVFASILDHMVKSTLDHIQYWFSKVDYFYHYYSSAWYTTRKKEWIGIPTDSLEALLSKLKVDPTIYISEMMEYLCSIDHRVFTPSQIWQARNSRGITRKQSTFLAEHVISRCRV